MYCWDLQFIEEMYCWDLQFIEQMYCWDLQFIEQMLHFYVTYLLHFYGAFTFIFLIWITGTSFTSSCRTTECEKFGYPGLHIKIYYCIESNQIKYINLNKIGSADKIDSVIISNKNLESDLHRICEFPATQKWQLKYRASRDGWHPENFHDKCDGIPNTLTIIRSTKGNIFGGFTEQAWNSYDEFVADPNAFIFSLINKEYKPFKAKCTDNGRHAIFSHRKYGPTFGSAYRGWTFDDSLFDISVSKKSHTFFGNAYKHPDFKKDTVRANSILAGEEKYFTLLEIEVFTRKPSGLLESLLVYF